MSGASFRARGAPSETEVPVTSSRIDTDDEDFDEGLAVTAEVCDFIRHCRTAAHDPGACQAFSVLAHQAVVDQAWDATLFPLLRKRFPNATQQDLDDARGYARGGSHLPDLGYFPLGGHLFTDLLHYVRTGDFYERAVKEARTAQEYAFALGMLAHYEADTIGHPEATNRAVPIIYPELAQKARQPARPTRTRRRRISRPSFVSTFCRSRIATKSRSCSNTRSSSRCLGNFSNACLKQTMVSSSTICSKTTTSQLNTYRWGFRTLIDEATGIAWELYREDIESLEPGIKRGDFVNQMSRADFVKEFGSAFLEPGYFARFVAFSGNLVPNVGPLKAPAIQAAAGNVKQLFFHAYRKCLQPVLERKSRVAGQDKILLPNLILDTGEPHRAGSVRASRQGLR